MHTGHTELTLWTVDSPELLQMAVTPPGVEVQLKALDVGEAEEVL